MSESFAAMEALAESGLVDVDGCNIDGISALHNMSFSGTIAGVRKCLELGCSVHARTNRQETPIYVTPDCASYR